MATEQTVGKLAFELVSPERLLMSKPVDMVVMPGTEGMFGVLKGHAPLIATLAPGVVDVYEAGQIVDKIFVGGGFAEVTGERCVVLAETALPISKIDRADAEAKLAAATTEDARRLYRAMAEAAKAA
ncbi:ATP synthase F1 subunit epsilon [Lacibacterium aquatile]|uniref:ATP synthase epsilon chain n=1 Tax=Lacibacterium aquatile TaxID=1168082 RepID=A0ABW5DYG2_9PROT